MQAANKVHVVRSADSVVLRFGMSETEDPKDLGEKAAELMIPLTTAARLGLALFESVMKSTVDLTAFFSSFQKAAEELNNLSPKLEKEKADIAERAAATSEEKA